MSETASRSLPARVPLVGILAASALVELVLNRIVLRLVHLDFLQPRSSLTRLVDAGGLFFFELAASLAVLMLGAGLVKVVVASSDFRPGARASLPLIGSVLVALAGLGVLVKLPPNLLFHLQMSFGFFSLLLLLATLASPAPARVKLGFFVLVAVLWLRIVPDVLVRFGRLPSSSPFRTEDLPQILLWLVVLSAVLFVPARGRGDWRPATIITWAVTGLAAILVKVDWETGARIAGYGFGVELPIQPWGQLLCLTALAAVSYTVWRNLLTPGVTRLRGWGLLLLALAGLSLTQPAQLALAAVGLLAIATSAMRVDGTPLTREAFEQLVRHAAGALGAGQVTITGAAGAEVARLHSPPSEGTPVTVIATRHSGVITDVEVSIGETPPRDPPFSLERRDAPGLGPHEKGAKVQTEDAAFDRDFVVYDKRGAGAPLLEDSTRARMRAQLRGWLGVWPQRGLRYRAPSLPAGEDALASLVAFLRELAQKSA